MTPHRNGNNMKAIKRAMNKVIGKKEVQQRYRKESHDSSQLPSSKSATAKLDNSPLTFDTENVAMDVEGFGNADGSTAKRMVIYNNPEEVSCNH